MGSIDGVNHIMSNMNILRREMYNRIWHFNKHSLIPYIKDHNLWPQGQIDYPKHVLSSSHYSQLCTKYKPPSSKNEGGVCALR